MTAPHASDLPDGLLRIVLEAFERHGRPDVPVVDATVALTRLWRGEDRRSSVRIIRGRLVTSFGRPDTPFERGVRFGYIDALAVETGRAHAGIEAAARTEAAR